MLGASWNRAIEILDSLFGELKELRHKRESTTE